MYVSLKSVNYRSWWMIKNNLPKISGSKTSSNTPIIVIVNLSISLEVIYFTFLLSKINSTVWKIM